MKYDEKKRGKKFETFFIQKKKNFHFIMINKPFINSVVYYFD